MLKELSDILISYLMGWKSIGDCVEWVSSIDWNTKMDSSTQEALGRIELLATEVLEGLRPEEDFWRAASELVTSQSNALFGQPMSRQTTFSSSSDSPNPNVLEVTPYLVSVQ